MKRETFDTLRRHILTVLSTRKSGVSLEKLYFLVACQTSFTAFSMVEFESTLKSLCSVDEISYGKNNRYYYH